MIGTTMGPYEIVEEIGSGGMATVYRAYQPAASRMVAVKVIMQNILNDADSLQRFRREARLVARLTHPHILPIYDFDGAHQPPYIVMRFLEGTSLKAILAKHLLPLPEIGYILRQVGSALDYAHQQGIIHRDIKASNIMVDRDGNAYVSDFGIAREGNELADTTITKTGVTVGTPEYISPEQAMAVRDVDQRTDVYSLGVLLFLMLTGRLPYTGGSALQTIMRHVQEAIPLPSAARPDLPPAIDQVILRAMAKEPEERFGSASDLASAAVDVLGATDLPLLLQTAAQESSLAQRDSSTTTDNIRAHALYRTPTEQNKVVTALYADAAEYAQMVEEQISAESARHAMVALWEQAAQIVSARAGIVVERRENTLLALWGAEAVREDDPEQAIRAALALQEALRQGGIVTSLTSGESLPLRIGVNTGPALLTPDERTGGYNASGSTVALASRLAESADGTILIGHETFRSVFGVFEMTADEPLKVRGRKENVTVYRVMAVKPRAFRRMMRGVEGIETATIGRDVELKLLQQTFLVALGFIRTQAVTIVGGAGVGKSRLLDSFRMWAELRPEDFRIFRGRATPGMRRSPYALLRDVLAFRCEILDSDNTAAVRDKLRRGLTELAPDCAPDAVPLIGQLAGFDFNDDPHVQPLLGSAVTFAAQAREAFINFIAVAAKAMPIVLHLEDMHDADNASLELLATLVGSRRDLPLLVVLVARPALLERQAMWGEVKEPFTRIDVQPLAQEHSRALIRDILQKVENPPDQLLDLIAERAEGNPFYIEELIKMLIEDRVIIKDGEMWQVEPSRLVNLSVPTTLAGLLQARLDTLLMPERAVLQRGSVFGRVFWENAIPALEGGDAVRLGAVGTLLRSLREREFVYQRSTSDFAGTREYAFTQLMLRDVVYSSMLSRQLQAYHGAAAEWLIHAAADRIEEYSATIADHYEKAGLPLPAAVYLMRAARAAIRISGYDSAIDMLKQTLRLLENNTQTEAQSLQIAASTRLGQVYSERGAHAEARVYLESALAVARILNDAHAVVDILGQLGRICMWLGSYELGQTYLREALPLARMLDDEPAVVFILRQLGNIALSVEAFEEAARQLEGSLTLARELGDLTAIAPALNSLGLTQYNVGDYTAALHRFEESLSLARETGRRFSIASCYINISLVHLALKDYPAARQTAQEALTIAREIGAEAIAAGALASLGGAEIGLGKAAAARTHLDEALRLDRTLGEIPFMMIMLPHYAVLRARAGQIDGSLELLGLVLAHPSAPSEARTGVRIALAALKQDSFAQLTDAQIEAGLARGKSLDLNAVIDQILTTG